jgi:HxlR-like helix-turn-helix
MGARQNGTGRADERPIIRWDAWSGAVAGRHAAWRDPAQAPQGQQRLGLSRNVLTQRLDRLVAEDMLTRLPYQERPVRHEYRLTEKGRDFFTVLAAMIRWGDRWLAGPGGPPIELRDRETGLPVDLQMIDARTGRPVDVCKIVAAPGPGLPKDLAERLREAMQPTSQAGNTAPSE